MKAKEIRQTFLNFFASKSHRIVPSAPMVIKNDPTLMFTNAGMNQFKDIFLGNATAPTPRAADSQKCLRVSGKHNDLEVVGRDGYHHTMFEMLGNWSYGDYFKTEAIDWAWELLTEVYKIDKTKLYATVFEGNKEDGTSVDSEAYQTWLKHLPKDHILYGNKKDNFWEMGDTGPCGPCSEIHIDLRSDEEIAKVPGASLVNKDNPLVIEIWNIVFMQYNRKADGSLELLAHKNIDTGMGFERLCMVLQGKTSNYDTDVFSGMIKKIEDICGLKYGKEEMVDVAMRVIADHIRAISFSIADGQLPGNVKAGYVIRRILRRAVRYGYTFLNMHEAFLYRLIDQLIDDLGEAYPELPKQKTLIENVIHEEENSFLHTLERGIHLLEDYMEASKESKVISGKDAFVLYDTYGFPIDLTELMATEKGYSIDLEGYNAELEVQKNKARNAATNEFGDWIIFAEGNTEFLGYTETKVKGAKLLKHRTVRQKKGEIYQLVFDKSPFYAEMGGQSGDTGVIISADGEKIKILDTVKENNLSVHLAEKIPQNCEGEFTLEIDALRRQKITCNHTATHLLDHSLRTILGTHIEQKGSHIAADYMRFDFSHFAKMTDEELHKAEDMVNAMIRENFPLEEFCDMNINEAMNMGAIALFGEKYGDKVRVIKFGNSIELCGGTHCKSTGEIGLFKIVSETAVAAGVRRVEVLTGEDAEKYVRKLQENLASAKALFNNTADLTGAIQKLLTENAQYRKQIEEFEAFKAKAFAQELVSKAEQVNGINLIKLTGEQDANLIKNAANHLLTNQENLALIAGITTSDKPQLIVMYSRDLVAKGKNAGTDIKEVSKLIQGGGGGNPSLATAGGRNKEGLAEAMQILISKL